MALSNLILDSRYVEQTGALALSLFNASICCASWGSHDILLAITSLLVSRVGIHSEAGERDFQLTICYTLSRVSLKRIPTISFFKHVIIWQVDFYELTYCFQLCVNCLFFFVSLLLSGFLVQ